MDYDVIVVGAGMAGLTATAYLAKSGFSTLLCEKGPTTGGLVHTFERNGFHFDGGIRAMENSGIILPMLKHLGLDVAFVRNRVSIGIEDRIIKVDSVEAVSDYETLLTDLYPESAADIAVIVAEIRKIMHYMDIQYGIKNPVFLDPRADRDYFIKAILPWMVKYAVTIGKVNALKEPVVTFLGRFTHNQSLIDIITQHFFRETPAYFALSYFSLYLDYFYPLGGTGTFATELTKFVLAHQGTIKTNTEIVSVDPEHHRVTDAAGNTTTYKTLIWAADLKTLYRCIDVENLGDDQVRRATQLRRDLVLSKTGGDSVLTIYLELDLDPSVFADTITEHFFYTPTREGQSQAGPLPTGQTREAIEAWLTRFLALTTYEISCPALRDPALAPPGKTGLIVSLLFDYGLTEQIRDMGWYDDFKKFAESTVVAILDRSVFPGLSGAVCNRFSATPLTISQIAGTSDGAITGWAFTNRPMPAENRLLKVTNSVRTPMPDILQAGQWTFSPSGLPTAILTGKLAADQATKALQRQR